MNFSSDTYKNKIIDKFTKETAVVSILGLGYVGLPLSICFAENGITTLGIDIDSEKVNKLNKGISYLHHIPGEKIKGFIDSGIFSATDDFSRITEVDAIIIGTINSSKVMSKGAAIAMQILIGASVSDKAKVSISVYDKDGTRIWNYGKEISGSAFANDDDLIRIVMRKTSRRFPYTGF